MIQPTSGARRVPRPAWGIIGAVLIVAIGSPAHMLGQRQLGKIIEVPRGNSDIARFSQVKAWHVEWNLTIDGQDDVLSGGDTEKSWHIHNKYSGTVELDDRSVSGAYPSWFAKSLDIPVNVHIDEEVGTVQRQASEGGGGAKYTDKVTWTGDGKDSISLPMLRTDMQKLTYELSVPLRLKGDAKPVVRSTQQGCEAGRNDACPESRRQPPLDVHLRFSDVHLPEVPGLLQGGLVKFGADQMLAALNITDASWSDDSARTRQDQYRLKLENPDAAPKGRVGPFIAEIPGSNRDKVKVLFWFTISRRN